MRLVNRKFGRLGVVFAIALVAMVVAPAAERTAVAQSGAENGKADEDCYRPDPNGEALGLDRSCPVKGSSGGVARGDFNGDAISDLAVGSSAEDIGTVQDAGSVTVIFGAVAGLTMTVTGSSLAPQLLHQNVTGVNSTAETSDRFGASLASGHFDGDSFSDLAVGVPGEEGNGAVQIFCGSNTGLLPAADTLIDETSVGLTPQSVYVIYGSSTGLSPTAGPGQRLIHQETTGVPGTSEDLDEFGAKLTAWNFGNDFLLVPGPCQLCFHTARLADLVIGVPGESLNDAGGTARSQAGRILVLYGTPSDGLTTNLLQDFNQNTSGMASEGGIEAGDRFGSALY